MKEPDPVDAEFIRAPSLEAKIFFSNGRFVGDCDDAATLAGALLLPAWSGELVALRLEGDVEFSHVWLESEGVIIDPIVPAGHLPIDAPGERMILPL